MTAHLTVRGSLIAATHNEESIYVRTEECRERRYADSPDRYNAERAAL
jgi:hypothetical protein